MESRAPRRGEIWSVYTPGQPEDPHQPRPALVVSEDVRNRMTDDVIVVPIFPTHIPIGEGVGGLPHDSVLLCEEITTITRDFMGDGPLGLGVSTGLLERVIRAVRRALGELVPEPE